MTIQEQTSKHIALNARLEEAGWGLFLIMIGALWLVPDATMPQGTWVIGAGLIMVGINVVRYVNGIRLNVFSLTLGFLALLAGTADIAGVRLPLFPIVLVAIGAMIVARPFLVRAA